MMTPRPVAIETRERQRLASDPSLSAWVYAHAGSGKTHVLSRRVVRLLLARTPPSRILCLTFTKAAAANMAARIFDILARWTQLDDNALRIEIEDVNASGATAADIDFARRLFARTVETPGGLKIQTIHAFCERLLHLFPFEANVGAGFRIMDDLERAETLEDARRRVIAHAILRGGTLHDAIIEVSRHIDNFGFDDLCRELLSQRAKLHGAVSRDDYAHELRRRLNLGPNETLPKICAQIVGGGITRDDWTSLASRLRNGGKNDGKLADALLRAAAATTISECVEEYLDVFFTGGGSPRGLGSAKIISGSLSKSESGLLEILEDERNRLAGLIDKRKAAEIVERSLAVVEIGDAIVGEYHTMKADRGLCDFDDLIERVCELLRRSSPSWVLYKLDSQIDHILLDEAQDTSAAQWEILAAIADEFCSGESARKARRTFFAVGDEKQSIFSFQGAAPEKFTQMRRELQRRFVTAEQKFEIVQLTRSFRSAPLILEAVDKVFSAHDNARGLSADMQEPPPRHEAWKTDVIGRIEIWDLIGAQQLQRPSDWRLPLDYVDEANPASRLSRKIARKIKSLLAAQSGEYVEDQGARRRVEPGDILILVRKRDAFFEAVIRALKADDVPVAGADRLDLTEHIAVMDLIALGRAALLREDDLSLATVLKSPFIGFDDDDLIAIAPERETSLFDALERSVASKHRKAAEQIAKWSIDAKQLSPFDFYQRVLGVDRGREKLLARLGPETNDAIDEFLRLALSYERERPPFLTSFLAMAETLDISIKRDMEAAGGAVRVMTAHAAKGLEAKIVFLPDTCGTPAGRHDPKLFALSDDGGDVTLAWSLRMSDDCDALARERARLRDAERDEHQRLLYVALTRAEERLYIAGFHGQKGPAAGCWYETVRSALEPWLDERPDPDDLERRILFKTSPSPPIIEPVSPAETRAAKMEIPCFARTPAPREETAAPPLRPSSALAGADVLMSLDSPRAASLAEGERLAIGRLTHALLQQLPQCPRERRYDAASRFLELRGAALDKGVRANLARAAIAVMEDDRLAPLFGEASVAEVDIAAQIDGPRGKIAVSGRIDRLAETETEVFVADFKTGRPRAVLDADHLRQLALYRAAVALIYPGKHVRCVLVWTQDASVIEPSAEALDVALTRVFESG